MSVSVTSGRSRYTEYEGLPRSAVRTVRSLKIHCSPLSESQTARIQRGNELVAGIRQGLLWRHVHGKARGALVKILVSQAFFPVIQAEEDHLRGVFSRVVLRNQLILRLMIRVFANDGLHILVLYPGEVCLLFNQRLQILAE